MNGFSWGGSEELWWNTAMYAHQQGSDVHVVVFKNSPVHKKLFALQQEGIQVNFIDKEEAAIIPLWKRVWRKLFNKPALLYYKDRFSFVQSLKADLVLLNQGATTDITYIPDLRKLLENLHTPYAILNHHHFEYGSLSGEQKKILLDVFLKASHLYFVANRNREVLERQLASIFSNAQIVKNPVNLIHNSNLAWPSEGVPSFAVVARFDVNFKGQDILLQALSADKWKARNFELNLFGHGPDEVYIKQLIQLYNLERKVFLKGHIDNIINVWQHNHLLILPSLSEGTPLSLVEAMLCGRPCLVTDVGDSAALVKDNKTGWIAYTASVKALDEALERAWAQQKEWEIMGKLAQKDAEQFIDINPGKTLFHKLFHT